VDLSLVLQAKLQNIQSRSCRLFIGCSFVVGKHRIGFDEAFRPPLELFITRRISKYLNSRLV
jgi:hypothetical protein